MSPAQPIIAVSQRPHPASSPAVSSTAGARSGKYAAQLGREGFANVRNMKGSLVSWVRSTVFAAPVGAQTCCASGRGAARVAFCGQCDVIPMK